MKALQISERGGEIGCIYNEENIVLSGSAITVEVGFISI